MTPLTGGSLYSLLMGMGFTIYVHVYCVIAVCCRLLHRSGQAVINQVKNARNCDR
jgi:hypothetical protein